jgi:hypothetical protein
MPLAPQCGLKLLLKDIAYLLMDGVNIGIGEGAIAGAINQTEGKTAATFGDTFADILIE